MLTRWMLYVSILLLTATSCNVTAYTTYGGGQSCGSYLEEMEVNSRKHGGDKGFIAGFLSGVAFGNEKYQPKMVDFTGILKWIESYCSEEPLEDLIGALEKLAVELNK